MKAAEFLRLDKNEELDFRGKNLRGQSFQGEDLSKADFSGADIRSTNFTDANLRMTNFTGAKAGLQKRWTILFLSVAFALLFLSSFFLTIMLTAIVNSVNSPELDDGFSGLLGISVLGFFAVFTLGTRHKWFKPLYINEIRKWERNLR